MPKSLFPVSVKIIFTDDQRTKVLIAYYDDNGYGLVGGHLNIGEDIHEAAVRETLEETGLNINSSELKQLGFIKHKHGKIVLLYAYCIPQKSSVIAQDDVRKLLWVSADDVRTGKYDLEDYREPVIKYLDN